MSSLAKRLTFRIMAVVFVMMAVVAATVFFTVRTYMRDEAKERYLGLLLENHQEVRRRLAEVSVAVDNNAHDFERDIDHPDRLYDHLVRIVKQNHSIAGCALIFEPDYYADQGRMFIPCARRDTAGHVSVMKVDSTFHNEFSEVWVPEHMNRNQSDWTPAYFESEQVTQGQEPRLLTSYAVPVHNSEGRAVALLVADLSLEELRLHIMDDIKEINDQYEKGQKHQTSLFIIQRDGIYVVHPDRKRMLTFFDERVGKTMMKHRGTCLTEVDGVMSRLYYRSIPNTDWTMVITTPRDVILSNAYQLNTIILLVMLTGLTVLYFICRRMIKDITTPVTVQQAAMESELKIAHDIQMAMLPKVFPPFPDRTDIDIYASETPARDVGGDLYDYFLRDDRLFFCIGDVSGKGIPAALLMAVMRSMFRSETRRAESAVEIVETMNRNLSEEVGTECYFVTMFVGILDLTTGHLDYCNAGHEAPLISGVALDVKPNLPVGALAEWKYEGQQTQLKSGDMLFLFTDGLSEAKNPSDQQLGRQHVLELIQTSSGTTAQRLVEAMDNAVHRHAAGAEQSDDVTLLAIKWQKTRLAMRATMDDIDQLKPYIEGIAQQAGIATKEMKRLRLAVEEAVSNVINYSHATVVTLDSKINDGHLSLTIDDDGQPFDPTVDSTTDLTIPPDERPPGGLGIMLLHKMTDSLSYQRLDNHNRLTILKKI